MHSFPYDLMNYGKNKRSRRSSNLLVHCKRNVTRMNLEDSTSIIKSPLELSVSWRTIKNNVKKCRKLELCKIQNQAKTTEASH